MTRQGVTQHLGALEAANFRGHDTTGHREKLHFRNPVPLQKIYDRWIAKFEKPRLKPHLRPIPHPFGSLRSLKPWPAQTRNYPNIRGVDPRLHHADSLALQVPN